jgi:ABC-type nitrate/sulfonate/bicarbonate transport system permease component
MVTQIRRASFRFNWLGFATIIGILAVWQILVDTKILDYSALPSPTEIVTGLRYIAGNGMWGELWHTISCVLIAWAIAVFLGATAGLLFSLNATLASWSSATVDVFRSLPVIALIPIAVLIWGTGSKAEIILGVYAGIWPMLINTAGGVRNLSPRLIDVARSLRLSRLETLVKIVIPSTGGAMLVGARLSLATCLVICVVAEILALQSGLGSALSLEQAGGQPARMWAYVLIVGTLGLLVNLGLVRLVRVAFPGVAASSERRTS